MNLILCGLPSDKGFLKDVFSVGHAAQHPVGNGEEAAPILLERREPARILRTAWPRSWRPPEFAIVPHTFSIPDAPA